MRSAMSVCPFGLRLVEVCALASLGVPRVVAHDLDLVGPAVNALLVFVPIAIWVGYVWWRRVPPLRALIAVGCAYGVVLAATHQILWTVAFDEPPRLGGTLEGQLSPGVEDMVLRGLSVGSSLLTGVALGVMTGAIAWLLARATDGHRAR